MTEEQAKQIYINTQYVKDLSFENPNAPKSLLPSQNKPSIDVSVDVKAQAMSKEEGKELFEVELSLICKATTGEGDDASTMFVCEVQYAGVFTLANIPDEEKQGALLVFCPSLLFPYARRVVSDATRDGGFPPLMLDPIDFGRLFTQRMAEAQKAEKAN